MRARRPLTRAAYTALLASLALTSVPGTASATTEPRAESLHSAQSDSIEDQIAAAKRELRDAQRALAATYEKVTTAQQRHDRAAKAAQQARARADRTRQAAKAADAKAEKLRQRVDEFAAASYRQGSTVGSVTAYLGADSPNDMLERASLLNALSGKQLGILDVTQRAVDEKTQADRAAQDALRDASANEAEAADAQADAERAYRDAVAQKDAAQDKVDELLARTSGLTQRATAKTVGASGVVLPATGTLTSTYGPRGGTIHYGIDLANSIGTPIYATMAGEVINSGPASGFGLWVRVRHDNGLITVYGHINTSLVSVGQRVDAGQQIATMGNRGQSTGPHLHFEVIDGGSKIDPLVWLRSHGVSL